jgi:hypothetical protein
LKLSPTEKSSFEGKNGTGMALRIVIVAYVMSLSIHGKEVSGIGLQRLGGILSAKVT